MNKIISASLDFIDTSFEKPGYIPFVSTVTGSLRIISSIVLLSGSLLSALYYHQKKSDYHLLEKNDPKKIAKMNINHCLKGIGKGCIEIIPIIGNLASLILQNKEKEIDILEKKLEEYTRDSDALQNKSKLLNEIQRDEKNQQLEEDAREIKKLKKETEINQVEYQAQIYQSSSFKEEIVPISIDPDSRKRSEQEHNIDEIDGLKAELDKNKSEKLIIEELATQLEEKEKCIQELEIQNKGLLSSNNTILEEKKVLEDELIKVNELILNILNEQNKPNKEALEFEKVIKEHMR